ncbi:MAG TPA: MFS transporter, partial [Aquaticitalea sp.]|nr:MFS transporter [Aquaticitalea sp.]
MNTAQIKVETPQTKTAYSVLFAVSFAHLLNDLIQGIIPAMYPSLEQKFELSMGQIGLLTLGFQLSASILQPIVGAFTDKYPKPFSQVFGMVFSSLGIVFLAHASSYAWCVVAVVLVGIGSSIFHPESSRVAFLASGGKRSLAQSIFQIGGNIGTAMAPLLIAFIVLPRAQIYILWFLVFAIVAKLTLLYVGRWYKKGLEINKTKPKKKLELPDLTTRKIAVSIGILLLLIFSKYFYVASITSYFQFYTIDKFGL